MVIRFSCCVFRDGLSVAPQRGFQPAMEAAPLSAALELAKRELVELLAPNENTSIASSSAIALPLYHVFTVVCEVFIRCTVVKTSSATRLWVEFRG